MGGQYPILNARDITERIRSNLAEARLLLIHMFENERWHELGYSSWEQYLQAEFDVSSSYLRRQTRAGLLEAEMDGNVGARKESHMRELLKADLKQSRHLQMAESIALVIATSSGKQVSAKMYKWGTLVVKNTLKPRLWNNTAYEVRRMKIIARFAEGEISELDFDEMLQYLLQIDDYRVFTLGDECVNSSELLLLLNRIRKTETFNEIWQSRTIPAYPDPVPIGKATAATLLAWLDEASAEHRAVARMGRRDFYKERNDIMLDIISIVRQDPPTEQLREYVKMLDDLEEQHDRP